MIKITADTVLLICGEQSISTTYGNQNFRICMWSFIVRYIWVCFLLKILYISSEELLYQLLELTNFILNN